MTKELSLYIPITKVDAVKRLVYGVATAESADRSGEICDYASTKPYYEKWSGEIEKATDGKSLGNVRAMHGHVAAGKVTSLSFNDDAKQIEICAKVVDDAEWNKVQEGVYTGFSQGGAYVKRWKDGELTRYTADPTEVSLVDLPCLPEATFQMIKADGVTEAVAFKAAPIEPAASKDTLENDSQDADAPNRNSGVIQLWLPDTEAFRKLGHVKKLDALVALEVAKSKETATNGDPFSKALDSLEAKLGIEKESSDDAALASKAVAKTELVLGLKKFTGEEVIDSSVAIDALGRIFALLRDELSEGESSEQVDALRAAIDRLKDFIVSEIQEDNDESTDALAMAATGALTKIGARTSASDKQKLQEIHDHARDMGAQCSDSDMDGKVADPEMVKNLESELAKARAENSARDDVMQKTVARIERLTQEVDALKSETVPLPVAAAARPVNKGHGSLHGSQEQTDVKVELEKLASTEEGRKELQILLIKAAHANPQSMGMAR